MKATASGPGRASLRGFYRVGRFAGISVVLMAAVCGAGAQSATSEIKSDARPAEVKRPQEVCQTIFLTNVTQQNDLNDIQTDLRNMLPHAKVYGIPTQNAITLWAAPDDVQLAQKLVAELDKPRKIYRLTYSIYEMEGGKRTGAQHFALIAASGSKTSFKQGSRVPIITGSYDTSSATANSQVQYVDVGLNIDATAEAYGDGIWLQTKVEQSSVADEKSGIGAQDPVIHQTTVNGVSALALGKPVVLGSLDVPGGTRHQEVEVVAEVVK